MARHDDISPVYPHPHVLSRYEVRGAVMAEHPAEFTVDPDPLAHCNFPREFHVAVTPLRMIGECEVRLPEECFDTLAGNHSRCGVFGFLFHREEFTGQRLCCTFCVPDKKGSGDSPVPGIDSGPFSGIHGCGQSARQFQAGPRRRDGWLPDTPYAPVQEHARPVHPRHHQVVPGHISGG